MTESIDQGWSMAGGTMTVPGRSEVIGRGEFRCLDCGTEWAAVDGDVGSCPVCPPLDVRFLNLLEAQSKKRAMTIPERCCVVLLLVFLFLAIVILLAANI